MIQINNLKKAFKAKVAVDINNLEFTEGELVGVVGNNGAGKTTMFRLMLDLLKADTGEVLLNNINTAKSEDWKSLCGAFIDSGFLIDFFTPEEYFYFVGQCHNLSKFDVDSRLKDFEKFMSGEILNQKKYIRNFSAGNKQKIGIIAAMLAKPKVLILDEPFNFIDPSSQIEIKRLLKQMNKECGTLMLLSSHNLDHITDVSTRIVLLEDGKLISNLSNLNGEAETQLNTYFEIN